MVFKCVSEMRESVLESRMRLNNNQNAAGEIVKIRSICVQKKLCINLKLFI